MSDCFWVAVVLSFTFSVAAWFLGRTSGLKEGIWLMEPLVKARFARLNAMTEGEDDGGS